ncbi:hypothetical protein [Rhodoferax sp. U11-2br]|uniref:hypothetical protein n=1 Tax=Rhodoferax sp. U11-2br TaxID=2838878 RepID=UPI001BE6E7C7|nr:hypothetical protein [Rhodoferax sp. U11-2br]MBT3065517.1 hypothetical protein [Rhodoferax sp. U11-2br]
MKRLKANASDAPRWARLADNYKVLDKLAEAVKAISLPESDANVIPQFVDLLVTPTHGDMKVHVVHNEITDARTKLAAHS